MKNDEIRKQLDDLRGEVRALNDSFINLRQDDLRAAMAEQIGPVLVEKVDRFFSETGAQGGEERQALERCRNALMTFLNESLVLFRRNGKDALTGFLDESEENITGPASACAQAGCSSFATDLVGQLRSYMDTYDHLSRPIPPEVQRPGRPLAPVERALSPPLVEEVLAPLANAWRINILMMLSKESATLAELSKALGLKKGHLQFHLKALVGPAYVAYDRRTHLYALTSKGRTALSGLASLIGDITTA